ncbi:hypothetical protein N566_25925 [Streptomycetaceae bacterium MP113-05]|nr:hypothetical protein N566_25925 [Streptomycetaceae bacterium MP113-05]
MSNGYKVDLSALDEVIKKLNRVVDDMGGPHTCARYETHLPSGWLGTNFDEEKGLYTEHNTTKNKIEGYISSLQDLIAKFSSDTAQVRRNYDDQEQQNSQSVSKNADLS